MADGSRSAQQIDRICSYFEGSRWLQGYVRGKLRTDPAYRAVLDELTGITLPVLDIGCGLGLLAFYLRENGFMGDIVGIDSAAAKIDKANRIAERHYPGISFLTKDARQVFGHRGVVVMLDVLHYLDDTEQQSLLEWIAEGLPAGGKAIIRNAPKDNSLRFFATYAEELFVRFTGWIRGGGINFPTIGEVAGPFERRGYKAFIQPLWGRTPFNSYLFVFTRT